MDKQPNFVFGLAGHVRLPAEAGEGRDKIQLRFQKRIRQLADAEPMNFDDARFLQQLAKELDAEYLTQKELMPKASLREKVKSQTEGMCVWTSV